MATQDPRSKRNIRLLSLDGGGVRGFSSLVILEQLMRTIDPQNPPKPCDYFDMIAGTSTGGLIAVMLGRLQLSIEQCKMAYRDMMNGVFRKVNSRVNLNPFYFGQVRGRFDTEALERAIRDVIRESGKDDTETMRNSDCPCKVFVCAVMEENSRGLGIFSSYEREDTLFDLFSGAKIWEACRATAAASTFFEPIAIGPDHVRFVDGATLANNPVNELWKEARREFGARHAPEAELDFEARVQLLVSIGTGKPAIQGFGGSLRKIGKTVLALAAQTELTRSTFESNHERLIMGGKYYRFNVEHGFENIGLERASERSTIATHTQTYMDEREVQEQLNRFRRHAQGDANEPIPVPEPLPPRPSVQKGLAFRNLDQSSRFVKPEQERIRNTYYWSRLTPHGMEVYNRVYESLREEGGQINYVVFHNSMMALNIRGVTQLLIDTVWQRLRDTERSPRNTSLTKPFTLAALYMLHMEAIVDPSFAPDHDPDSADVTWLGRDRIKLIRRFDRWVSCECGCGRLWNFASHLDDPLVDASRQSKGRRCVDDLDSPGGSPKPTWTLGVLGRSKAMEARRADADALRRRNLLKWMRTVRDPQQPA